MSRSFAVLGSAVAVLLSVAACGSASSGNRPGTLRNPGGMTGSKQAPEERASGRCTRQGAEQVVLDTNHDGTPDVRKHYLRVGQGRTARLVMVCREVDLNYDGIKDVFRFYNDEGRPTREEADRDFDGRIDVMAYFEGGTIAREEWDTNRDARADTWIYFERGAPNRGERDTNFDGRADAWEYYEGGHVQRIGYDLDNDGRVDQWDRDQSRQHREAPRPAGGAPGTSELPGGGGGGGGGGGASERGGAAAPAGTAATAPSAATPAARPPAGPRR